MSKHFLEVSQPKDGVQVLKSCIRVKSQVGQSQIKNNSQESNEKLSKFASNQHLHSHHSSQNNSDEIQLGSKKLIKVASERQVKFKDDLNKKKSTNNRQKLREQELKIMEYEKKFKTSQSPDLHAQQEAMVQQAMRKKERKERRDKKKKSQEIKDNNLNGIILNVDEMSVEDSVKELRERENKFQQKSGLNSIIYQKSIQEEKISEQSQQVIQPQQSSQAIKVNQGTVASKYVEQKPAIQQQQQPKKAESKTKCSCIVF